MTSSTSSARNVEAYLMFDPVADVTLILDVAPAKAGTNVSHNTPTLHVGSWIPAFAGMTTGATAFTDLNWRHLS